MLLAVVKPLKSGTATPPQATEVFSLSQEISCIFSRVKFKLLFSSSACAPQQQRNSNWGGCFVKPQHEATEPQLPVLKPLSAPWLSSFPAHTTFPQVSCTHFGALATSAPGIFFFLPHFFFPRPPSSAAAPRTWLQLCSCAAQLFPGKSTAMPSLSCSHSCSREKGNFDPSTPTLGIPSLVCIPRSSVSPEPSAPLWISDKTIPSAPFTLHSPTDASLQESLQNQCFAFSVIIHNNLWELLPAAVALSLLEMSFAVTGIPPAPRRCC